MARVKICGINDPEAFDAAMGADWIGFAFFPPSPRYVSAETARELSARHPGGPLRVGLFVNPTQDAIAAVLDVVKLDILQIYGPAEGLRERFGLPVWRPVGVTVAPELPGAMDGADALLIEAKPPPYATRPGGNALRFDWAITQGWRAPGDWILAGGLDPGNVAAAILASGAPAVDVSSGVERAKGVKDPALIRAFIAAARGL